MTAKEHRANIRRARALDADSKADRREPRAEPRPFTDYRASGLSARSESQGYMHG